MFRSCQYIYFNHQILFRHSDYSVKMKTALTVILLLFCSHFEVTHASCLFPCLWRERTFSTIQSHDHQYFYNNATLITGESLIGGYKCFQTAGNVVIVKAPSFDEFICIIFRKTSGHWLDFYLQYGNERYDIIPTDGKFNEHQICELCSFDVNTTLGMHVIDQSYGVIPDFDESKLCNFPTGCPGDSEKTACPLEELPPIPCDQPPKRCHKQRR